MSDRPTITTLPAGAKYDTSTLNANFLALRDAADNIVGRAGTSGSNNTMTGDLDLDSNFIRNALFAASSVDFGWQGDWVTATDYLVNEVVEDSGSSYICLISHTSDVFAADLAAAKWDLLAQKGDTGATGSTGATGAQGDKGDTGDTGPAGSGDVSGPGSATDSAVALFDGTTGGLLKDGVILGTSTTNIPQVGTKSSTTALAGLVEKSTSAENVTGTDDTVWPTVAGTKEMIDTHGSGGGSTPNLIINGGFQVNQRVYVSTTATADGVYMHDRWRSGSTDSSYTFSVASPASPQTITIAANDSIEQVIEGSMILTAGTHTIAWTGTATARAVVNTQTMSGNFAVSPITVTAVKDQVITVQFTGADAVGGSTEATDTGTLAGVMCVLGSTVPSTFVAAGDGYDGELARCQRYLPALLADADDAHMGAQGVCISTTLGNLGILFPVTPRVAPTGITVSNVTHFKLSHTGFSFAATTNLIYNKGGLQGIDIRATIGSADLVVGDITILRTNNAGAFILFTGCEL